LVRSKCRYVFNKEVEEFLEAIKNSVYKRIEGVSKGKMFFRAQNGTDYFEDEENGISLPVPYSKKRMKPRPNQAKQGRVNPTGIPYLYGATKLETAIAEVRPWIGDLVTVGMLELKKDVSIVNCTMSDIDSGFYMYFEEPGPKTKNEEVWKDVDRSFSYPVSNSDDVASYIPTQVLSEFIRELVYEGIAYRSSLGPGFNIALFDIDAADIHSRKIYEVKRIKHEFEEYMINR